MSTSSKHTHTELSDLRETLEELDTSALQKHYNELLHIWSGKPPEEYKESSKRIWIIESSNVERGGLIKRIAGSNVLDFCLPSSRNPLGNAFICYVCDTTTDVPRYSYKDANGQYVEIDQIKAQSAIDNQNTTAGYPLYIHVNLINIPDGWSFQVCPFVTCDELLSKATHWVPIEDIYVAVLRDLKTADECFRDSSEHNSIRNPNLIALDSNEEDEYTIDGSTKRDVSHGKVSTFTTTEEAPSILVRHITSSNIYSKLERHELIDSISKTHGYAATTLAGKRDVFSSGKHAELILKKARIEWRKLFVNERREAIRDVRIEMIAHPFRKSTLITKGPREAAVARYVMEQLQPRIRLFTEQLESIIQEHHLNLAQIRLNSDKLNKKYNEIRYAGLMFALPSLGLLLPSAWLERESMSLLSASGVTENVSAASNPFTEIYEKEYSTEIDLGWLGSYKFDISDAVHGIAKSLESSMAHLLHNNGDMGEHVQNLTEATTKLVGVISSAAVATAAGVVIVGVIRLKASLGLQYTEGMILDTLNRCEQCWPQIENSIKSSLPAILGELPAETLKKAEKIHTLSNNISNAQYDLA